MEERLQKILARAGYGSRRQCEELIQYGRVRINGKTAQLGAKADPAADAIVVDDKKIKLEEFNFRYIALNKPRNVLSDCDSFGERKTVHDLIGTSEHMFAVGRLDFDSEGLILMTNDGDLANKLTHPRYGHEKEYHVKVAKTPDEKQLAVWRRGVVLADGYKTAPAIVQVLKSDSTFALLKVILREGRKRQIREVGSLIGLPVSRILRVRIGTLQLGSLKPGEWRDLTPKEVYNLKATAGAPRTDKKPQSRTRLMNRRSEWSPRITSEDEESFDRPAWKNRGREGSQETPQREYSPRKERFEGNRPARPAGAGGAAKRTHRSTTNRSQIPGSDAPNRRPRKNGDDSYRSEPSENRGRFTRSTGDSQTVTSEHQERRSRWTGDFNETGARSRSGPSNSTSRSPRSSGNSSNRPPAGGVRTGRPRSGSTSNRKPR